MKLNERRQDQYFENSSKTEIGTCISTNEFTFTQKILEFEDESLLIKNYVEKQTYSNKIHVWVCSQAKE